MMSATDSAATCSVSSRLSNSGCACGATGVQSVTVNGQQGFWITGAHKIVFLDRDGNVETDSVRRAGPVLAWKRGA